MALRPSVAERRRQVLVGELPNDFLRLIVPGSSTGVAGGADASCGAGQLDPVDPAMAHQQQPVYSFVPPNTRGRLSVTILEANLAKNYGLVRMDPYCRLRVGHAVFETQTKLSGGRTPFWNRIVHAWLPVNVESIYVQIFDERAFSADECIAHAHIMLPPGIFNGETIDEFYPLTGQQGEGKEGMVHLVISFMPLGGDVHGMPPVDPAAAVAAAAAGALPPAVAEITIDEEEVKAVHEMFPDVDPEVIRAVLESKRGDQNAAVTALLEMTK